MLRVLFVEERAALPAAQYTPAVVLVLSLLEDNMSKDSSKVMGMDSMDIGKVYPNTLQYLHAHDHHAHDLQAPLH